MKEPRFNYQTENSVHHLFSALPRPAVHRLAKKVNCLAPAYGLTYEDDKGKTAKITLTLRPRVLSRKKSDHLWKIMQCLDGAFAKITGIYLKHPSAARLFPFSPQEREWLRILEMPGYRPGKIASRWDANTTFGDREWRDGFSFFEVNGVGVGGLWYGPACAEVALKVIVPELKKMDPCFRPFLYPDMRRLLLGLLLGQRKKLGRTRGHIALAMEKASGSNYVEFERLAALFRKLGHPSLVTEPTDFRSRDGEIFSRGKKIDVIYRDTTLSELCSFEEKGYDLSALQTAFRQGQVISSLEGEFDHKSAFELFTSPEFANAFSAHERKIFKEHILWTRLLDERKTTDPKGRNVDLIPFILKNQSQMVLKPNRLYGGKGVVFGREVRASEWKTKIEAGLREPGEWVIQKLGELRKKSFFRPDEKGAKEKELYVVSGFFSTDQGLGIVGRMSERGVVNVARRGGLTPILMIR